MPTPLQVIENPSQESPEIAGAKYWVDQLFNHLRDPNDKEAYEYLKRQNDADVSGRPKPKLVFSRHA